MLYYLALNTVYEMQCPFVNIFNVFCQYFEKKMKYIGYLRSQNIQIFRPKGPKSGYGQNSKVATSACIAFFFSKIELFAKIWMEENICTGGINFGPK